MKLKLILPIFILYMPFANAVNLVCQANERADYMSFGNVDCSNGCEYTSDESFSVVFDSNKDRVIEVTNLSIFSGQNFYDEEITPSNVYFTLPQSGTKKGDFNRIEVSIERVSGKFSAYSYSKKDAALRSYNGRCVIGKKLF
jgi:hypothetical protein